MLHRDVSVNFYQTTRHNIPEDRAVMMEVGSTSETSENFFQATRRNIPEDSHLHTRRLENVKSRLHTYNFHLGYDISFHSGYDVFEVIVCAHPVSSLLLSSKIHSISRSLFFFAVVHSL
jgi:hypothetical protein